MGVEQSVGIELVVAISRNKIFDNNSCSKYIYGYGCDCNCGLKKETYILYIPQDSDLYGLVFGLIGLSISELGKIYEEQ